MGPEDGATMMFWDRFPVPSITYYWLCRTSVLIFVYALLVIGGGLVLWLESKNGGKKSNVYLFFIWLFGVIIFLPAVLFIQSLQLSVLPFIVFHEPLYRQKSFSWASTQHWAWLSGDWTHYFKKIFLLPFLSSVDRR
jgi:hypothetical protein